MEFHDDPEDEPTGRGLEPKNDRCAAPLPTIADREAYLLALGEHVRRVEEVARRIEESFRIAKVQEQLDGNVRSEIKQLRRSISEFEASVIERIDTLTTAVHDALDLVRGRPCLARPHIVSDRSAE